jgi:MFS family permease
MLLETMRRIYVPFVSLILLILGHGYFNTLVTLRMHHEGFSPIAIGVVAAMYYLGLVIGAFKIEAFVVRVGHIRAYAAFASSLAVVSMLLGFWINIAYWMFLRVIYGYCVACLP